MRTKSRLVERSPAVVRCDVGDPEAGERERQLREHRLDDRELEVVRAALEDDVEPGVGDEQRARGGCSGRQPRMAVPGAECRQQEREREYGVKAGPGEIPVLSQVMRRQRGREPDGPGQRRLA